MDVIGFFGRAVRARRQQLGWSQEELADRAGLHRTYIGGIERGERNVSLRNLDLIARTLGTTAAALLDHSAKKDATEDD
jgi:transcriptional regulator with XRE-family HTH domain